MAIFQKSLLKGADWILPAIFISSEDQQKLGTQYPHDSSGTRDKIYIQVLLRTLAKRTFLSWPVSMEDRGVWKTISWHKYYCYVFINIIILLFKSCSKTFKDTNILDSCNYHCGCEENVFKPVCGSDDISYISPCHAGCLNVSESISGENVWLIWRVLNDVSTHRQ